VTQPAPTFAPSLHKAREAGIKIHHAEYPVGVDGIHLSLDQMALRMREGRLDPAVRGWAGDVLIAAGRPQTVQGQVQALLEAVRQVTVYAHDPVGSEYISGAAATLCLRPGLCIRAADCFPSGTLLLRDDHALVPIDEIKIGDRIWGLDRWTRVVNKWSQGELSLDAIVLNNGSVVHLTPDHHVFVGECEKHPSHWKCGPCSCPWESLKISRITVAELKPGMRMPQPKRIPFGSGHDDPGCAYIDGLYISEGWSGTESRNFSISGCDGFRKEVLKHEVKAICDRLGIETRWHRKSITVKSPVWAKKLAGCGTHGPTKQIRTLDLDEQTAAELLRGVMSDSTANTNGPGRTFSTTSPVLKTQVRVLQRMFGRSMNVHFLPPALHKGFGQNPLWRMGLRKANNGRTEKLLRTKEVQRDVSTAPCFDITTEDSFVYLPEHDVTVSQCDDLSVALGSAIMSVGIPVMICKQTYGAGDQEHVLIVFQDEMGNWLPADPTHPTWPAGQMAPATRNDYVDPMSPNLAGVAGLPEADFVGVGSVKVREILGLGAACGDTCCSIAAGEAPCSGCHTGLGEVYPEGTHDPALAPPAPAYTYDQASTDLQNQVAAVITAADGYLSAGEIANAIQAYQAAGNAGATGVGPEIDLAGQPNLTQAWTHWAWTINAQLAAIPSTSTSQTDATNAQNLAKQMLSLYQDAIGVATGSNGVLQIPPQIIVGTPTPNPSAVQGVVAAVALGAAAGLVLSYMQSRPKRRR